MVGLDPVLYWSALTVAAVAILVPGVSAAVASVAALLLIAGPVLLAAAPSSAPWFSVPVALLLFAPGLIALRVNALIAADRYAAAHRLALVRALLHPFDGAFALARYCRAMVLLQRGREPAALALLRTVAAAPSTIGVLASILLCTGRDDAEAVLNDARLAEPTGILRMRVLAAAGQLDTMIDDYRALMVERAVLPMAQESARALIVLMHAGRPAGVNALDTGLRAGTSRASAAYHVAFAELAVRPDDERALAVLGDQSLSDDGLIRRRASLRLAETPMPAISLTAERTAFLDRLEAAIEALPRRRSFWRAPASLMLIALNVAAFLAEAAAGSTTDNEILYRLGALPTVGFVWPTDAWRLGSEMFLHSGPIHIGANMLTLLVLGPPLERMLGPSCLLMLYLGSGLAANMGCVFLASAGLLRPELIVGASGAIMGLVGGIAGSALRQWAGTRSPLEGRRLLVILAFLGLQFAIDATIPRVSSATHLLGAGAGLLLGLVLPFRWPAPAASFADSIEPIGKGTARADPQPSPKWRRLAPLVAIVSFAVSLYLAYKAG